MPAALPVGGDGYHEMGSNSNNMGMGGDTMGRQFQIQGQNFGMGGCAMGCGCAMSGCGGVSASSACMGGNDFGMQMGCGQSAHGCGGGAVCGQACNGTTCGMGTGCCPGPGCGMNSGTSCGVGPSCSGMGGFCGGMGAGQAVGMMCGGCGGMGCRCCGTSCGCREAGGEVHEYNVAVAELEEVINSAEFGKFIDFCRMQGMFDRAFPPAVLCIRHHLCICACSHLHSLLRCTSMCQCVLLCA